MEELLGEVPVPEDWDDHAGWERYYASLSDAAMGSDAADLGSFGVDQLSALIGDLRQQSRTSLWLPGCGLSHLPKLLSRFGFSVHATDVSPTAIRFQTGDRNDVRRLTDQLTAAGLEPSPSPGPFVAAVHDARTPYLEAAFDLVLNARAFQGFTRPSMDKVAASHFAALRPGGQAVFDTTNVQGERRDELEGCLVDAGFYVPLYESNRRLRRALATTGIPHVFVLGRPVIPRTGPYLDDAKRQADTAVLRRIFSDYEARLEGEYEAEQRRVGPDARIATVIYSTG